MSRSEDWYKYPNHREYFIEIYSLIPNLSQRIRVRIIKTPHGKKGRKRVETFSVGYEIFINNRWRAIVRHCNYHESERAFHTHNTKKLPCLGSTRKIPRKNRKRTPTSQLTWSINNIKLNYQTYLKECLKKYDT